MATENKKTISFHYHETPFRMQKSSWIKKHLEGVIKSEKLKYSKITYIFSNDDFILDMNRQYLQHDYFTDILTFTLSGPEESLKSEIYISIDRVRENAKKFQSTFQRELYRVLVHGILHLSGYNDHTENEKKIMRQKEDFYINKVF